MCSGSVRQGLQQRQQSWPGGAHRLSMRCENWLKDKTGPMAQHEASGERVLSSRGWQQAHTRCRDAPGLVWPQRSRSCRNAVTRPKNCPKNHFNFCAILREKKTTSTKTLCLFVCATAQSEQTMLIRTVSNVPQKKPCPARLCVRNSGISHLRPRKEIGDKK